MGGREGGEAQRKGGRGGREWEGGEERAPGEAVVAAGLGKEEWSEELTAASPRRAGGKSVGLSELVKREVRGAAVAAALAGGEEVAAARPLAGPSRAPNFDSLEPIRPIAAGKRSRVAASPFVEAKVPAAAPRPLPTEQQTFDERLTAGASGGRFDRVTPTVEEGEDLDVPTFLRRKR